MIIDIDDLQKTVEPGVIVDILKDKDSRFQAQSVKAAQELLTHAKNTYKQGYIQNAIDSLVKASEYCDNANLEKQSIQLLQFAQKMVG